MGRELKRVPLNFSWPLSKIWSGYQNPHYEGHCTDCPHCEGGYSPEYKALEKRWYGYVPFKPEDRGSVPFAHDHPKVWAFAERNVAHSPSYYGCGLDAVRREAMRLAELFNSSWNHHLNADDVAALIKADRLWDFTRTPRTDKQRALVAKRLATGKHNSWLPRSNGYIPTPQEVNEWSIAGFGHDSSNCWIVCKAECERQGKPHTCSHCKGEASVWDSKANKTRANRWRRKEPPRGVGYQIWETVSEGSPISPVFKTPEALADWMAAPGNGWRSDQGTTREQWLRFINGPGWAPTLVSSPATGVVTGVQAV